jgi:hypothetical protein
MPTRKQRRRRSKERRHEYEYVYVDDEGREVEIEPEEGDERSRRNGRREAKQRDTKRPGQRSRQGRPIRRVEPPSWRRVGKRALLFGPVIFVGFTVINSGQPLAGRLAVAAAYTAFFLPFMYMLDRAMYRSYLKRTGQQLPPRPSRNR